jgi:hypothetical protein
LRGRHDARFCWRKTDGQGIFAWQARCEILLAQNSIIDVFAKANDLVLADKGLKYRGGVPE